MAVESVVLDGLALNDNTTFYLEALAVTVGGKRYEWVSGADSDGSVLAGPPRFENGTVEMRVRVVQQATMDLALAKVRLVEQKLEEAPKAERGIELQWTPKDATKTGRMRVLAGEITDLPVTETGDGVGWFQRTPVFSVRLTCEPFILGEEITVAPVTSSDPLVEMTVGSVPGDVPAECRVIVTDAASQSRRHVELGMEARDYPTSGLGPPLILDSASLDRTGYPSATASRPGAYNASGTVWMNVGSQWAAMCSTGVQAHVGTFRVRARVYAPAGEVPASAGLRLSWQAGDGPRRSNQAAFFAPDGTFRELDLGLITIPEAKAGAQKWQGVIEASSSPDYTQLHLDYLLLIPAERYALVSSGRGRNAGTVVGFDTLSGAPIGQPLNDRNTLVGAWQYQTPAASADFVVAGTDFAHGRQFRRAVASTRGFGILSGGVSRTDTDVHALFYAHDAGTGLAVGEPGIVARYTDTSNWLLFALGRNYLSAGEPVLRLVQSVAGSQTILAETRIYGAKLTNEPVRLRLVVYASGRATGTLTAYAAVAGAGELARVTAYASTLATGGSLASGYPGIADYGPSTQSRFYGEYAFGVPGAEPIVVHSGRTLAVRSDTCVRQDSAGVYYGAPPSYRGGRPLLEPAGTKGRRNRVVVKARRDDVTVAADGFIADSTTVQVAYTPRYLTPPS